MRIPNQSLGFIRSNKIFRKSVPADGVKPLQSILDSTLLQPPLFTCTKWCKDCQNCATYCCQGTTPTDLAVVVQRPSTS